MVILRDGTDIPLGVIEAHRQLLETLDLRTFFFFSLGSSVTVVSWLPLSFLGCVYLTILFKFEV